MRRRVLSLGLLAFAALATMGAVEVRRLLDRPGETALAFLPANAKGVACLDLVPAPDQVLAFKSIDDIIAKATNAKPASPSALAGTFLSDPTLKSLVADAGESLAGAWLPNPNGKDDDVTFVALFAMKDPADAARILRAKGRLQNATGTEMYGLKPKDMPEGYAMVHGDYLVVSDQAWAVAAVAKVMQGQAKAITDVPGFASARKRALDSSNLMVILSPEIVHGKEWAVASMSIRDTGLEVAISGDTNDPEALKAGSLAPIGSQVIAGLPRGAYGFLAAAQPGPAVALMGKELDDPAKSVKDESDLDLKEDVLPALGGNVVVGFYPSVGMDAGFDLLVSVDDANGADPASLAKRLEQTVGKEIEKDTPGWKVTLESNGTTVNRLADKPANEMRDALHEVEKSFFRPLTLSRGKTVAWASVGRSVLLATSQDLLDRAVAARKSPSAATGLSGDVNFGIDPAKAADGQFALAIGMKRMVEGIRNTVDPSHMSADSATIYRRGLGLYDNTTEPLAIRGGMDASGHYKGFVSIPLDWSKLPGLMK